MPTSSSGQQRVWQDIDQYAAHPPGPADLQSISDSEDGELGATVGSAPQETKRERRRRQQQEKQVRGRWVVMDDSTNPVRHAAEWKSGFAASVGCLQCCVINAQALIFNANEPRL